MKTSSRLTTPLSILAFLALSATATAAKVEETITHQIPVQAITSIDLSNVNGSIQCIGTDTDTIELICTMSAKSNNKKTAQEYIDTIAIDIVNNGEELKVKTKLPKSKSGFWKWVTGNNTSASVQYVMNIPESLNVAIDSVNGGVKVESISGEVDLQTVNGGIQAQGISGAANVETVNGGINVTFSEGLVLNENMNFQTVNGGVKVSLPKTAAFDLTVETVNGGISCDYALPEDAIKKRRSLEAKINGGGHKLSVETVNGGVGIHSL